MEEKLAIVKDLFKGMGWIIPDILEEMNNDKKIYFDSVSQIKMTQYSQRQEYLLLRLFLGFY